MENNFRSTARTDWYARTVWYPADIKPVHNGWYECLVHRIEIPYTLKRYWYKEGWYYNEFPIGGHFFKCLHQDYTWRGLVLPYRKPNKHEPIRSFRQSS